MESHEISDMSFGKVNELFPDFSDELAALLRDAGESDLARQIPGLGVIDRCRCGESSCATFYTADRPQGAWKGEHHNLLLGADRGMLIVDVVDGRIACVEVLDRSDVKVLLDRAVPIKRRPGG